MPVFSAYCISHMEYVAVCGMLEKASCEGILMWALGFKV